MKRPIDRFQISFPLRLHVCFVYCLAFWIIERTVPFIQMKLNIVYRSICIIIYLLYSHIRENGKILPSIFIPHTAAFYNTLHFRCTGSEKEIMKLWTREGADKAFNLWIAYHLKRTGAAFPWLLQNPEIVSCYYIGRKV